MFSQVAEFKFKTLALSMKVSPHSCENCIPRVEKNILRKQNLFEKFLIVWLLPVSGQKNSTLSHFWRNNFNGFVITAFSSPQEVFDSKYVFFINFYIFIILERRAKTYPNFNKTFRQGYQKCLLLVQKIISWKKFFFL